MESILLGMAIGDAVGVPVEFQSRQQREKDPVTDMREYGVHGQPIGTWSDDSQLAFNMLESLIWGWNLKDMGERFVSWYRHGTWTPHGRVFDAGFTTISAIEKFEKGIYPPNMCGGMSITSNGNGSVMRILPIVPYFIHNNIDSSVIRYKMCSDLSSITHAHPISVMSCFILTEFARHLYFSRTSLHKNNIKRQALMNMKLEINSIKDLIPFNPQFFDKFKLILDGNALEFEKLDENLFSGDGFCVNTVMTSIFCILTTDNYKDAVLKAVNFGDDTDTTACVTGGLAGILYGKEGIPTEWVDNLVKKDDIIDLATRYEQKYKGIE